MKLLKTTFFLLLLASFQSKGQDGKEITTNTGLRYTVLKVGKGEVAKTGQAVAIYESMGYPSGKQLYAIARPAPPLKFILGRRQVIEGVDQGVTGMKVGEIRKLIVPPTLSKRAEYPAYVSKDSTLIYTVELVEIVKDE